MSDMEQRLRDAFSAKADHVTNQSLHGGLPNLNPIDPEPPRRWNSSRIVRTSLPFLAAAAIVAIVAGAFVVGRSTQADRSPAGSEPASPPSTVTVTVSATPTPTPTTTAATPSSVVLAQGVSAAIPSTWQEFAGPKDDSPFGTQCWGANGACELAVYRSDNEIMFGKPLTDLMCTSVPVQTYDMTRIDGHDVEHIVYGAACGNPAAEEWVVPSRPQVYLLHPLGTDDALVEDAVGHATLPGAYGPLPGIDYGFIDSVAKNGGDNYTVTVSRAILRGSQWERWSPAVTYSFPMSTTTGGFLCYAWRIPDREKTANCTVADLYLQGQKGDDPVDGSRALGSLPILIQSDGGKVQYIDYVESAKCACPR